MTGFDFRGARQAVRDLARTTPLLLDEELSDQVGVSVWMKCECLQVTGSFKVRGAAARLAALTPEQRDWGVVTCSSGNHGRAIAYVAGQLDIPATIYVPEWVDPVKLEGIRAGGAEAVLAGSTFDEAEARAIADAAADGKTFVSAYDDPYVIAGQGTLASEIADQLGGTPGAVLAPLSGGGLVGGIAAGYVSLGPTPHIVAVSAERARVMHASIRAGLPVELPEEETLAGALAGGIGLDNRHSFALVRDRVDEHILVEEDDIASAMAYAATRLRLVVEGGGAVALAALLNGSWEPARGSGSVVVILSGGNVAPEVLADVLESPHSATAQK